MSIEYMAEKNVGHRAVATMPDLMIPPGSTVPVPCITFATFDTAELTAMLTRGNHRELFTKQSFVPHCLGGIPNAKGVKSGSWNGKFVPTECSDAVRARGYGVVYNGHKGTINNGNATAMVITTMSPSVIPSQATKVSDIAHENLSNQAQNDFMKNKEDFLSKVGKGVFASIKEFKDIKTAFASVTGAYTTIKNIMENPIQLLIRQESKNSGRSIKTNNPQYSAENSELNNKIKILNESQLAMLQDNKIASEVLEQTQDFVKIAKALYLGKLNLTDIIDTTDAAFMVADDKTRLAIAQEIQKGIDLGNSDIVIGNQITLLQETTIEANRHNPNIELDVYSLLKHTNSIKQNL